MHLMLKQSLQQININLTINYWIGQVYSFIRSLVFQTPKWPVLVSIIDLMDAPNVHFFTDSYN